MFKSSKFLLGVFYYHLSVLCISRIFWKSNSEMDCIFYLETVENLRRSIKGYLALFTYMGLFTCTIWHDDVALTDDVATFYWTNDVALTADVALIDDVAHLLSSRKCIFIKEKIVILHSKSR